MNSRTGPRSAPSSPCPFTRAKLADSEGMRKRLPDESGKLLELRRSRGTEQVEEHRLGAGQDGAGFFAKIQPDPAVLLGARNDGVPGDEDLEILAQQVADGLVDADVGFHPDRDHLATARALDRGGERRGARAGETRSSRWAARTTAREEEPPSF